jgi:hypothetical protein
MARAAKSLATARFVRLASLVTAINVLVVLSAWPIIGKRANHLSYEKAKLAMAVHATRAHYRIRAIQPRHFDQLASQLGLARNANTLLAQIQAATPQQDRIDYITRFVLENPELIKLWIEDFVSPGDIRGSYPYWDALVEVFKTNTAGNGADDTIDAEVFCVILLTSTIIAPRVFRNRVSSGKDTETVVRRFRAEQLRWLKQLGLIRN